MSSSEPTVVERFLVGRHFCHIRRVGPDQFEVWYKGCLISSAMTLPLARDRLHGYLISQHLAEKGAAESDLARVRLTLDRLGNDPFNLGKFVMEPGS